jgi:hypothetical protein
MKRRKKKSTGWRPADKRRPWAETKERMLAEQDARFMAQSDRLGLWRSCPAALCKRKRRCAVDPYRCTKERGDKAKAAAKATAGAGATPPAKPPTQEVPRFAISAKEAAAFITADVASHLAKHGNDPDGLLRGGVG